MDSKRPALAFASIADDDDSQFSNPSTNNPMVDRKAIAYLLRYETMVRQQEAEHMATLAHLRPFLDHHLDGDVGTLVNEDADFLEKEISFGQIERALKELQKSSQSYMQTDRQLVMVLKTMSQKVKQNMISNKKTLKEQNAQSITWAEFLQCYKTVISGMQTLQHVTTSPTNRGRVKDRTLSMISLFEPPASKLLGIPRDIDIFEQSSSSSSKNTNKRVAMRKKAIYAVMGAILGVTVASTAAHLHPELFGAAITVEPSSSLIMPAAAPDCKKTIEYVEKKIYIPVESSKSMFQPATSPRRAASMDTRQKPTPLPKTTPKSQNNAALSAAVGGAAGMVAAPIIWTTFQRLPGLMASTAGGWGIATVAGVVLLQGLVHGLGSLVREAVNKRRGGAKRK